MTVDNPTRNQYLTICGGLPPQRTKTCDLTPRELREIDAVKMAVHAHSRFHKTVVSNWSRLPTDASGAVVVHLNKIVHLDKPEIYRSPQSFADDTIVKLWKAIGTPIITQEDIETFHVEDGVWPYVASDEGREEHDILRVEDRLIDIDHVCSLIENDFADLLMYFWGQEAFNIIKMAQDFLDHLTINGLDDMGRAKMKLIEEEIYPFALGTLNSHLNNGYRVLMKKESEADIKQ